MKKFSFSFLILTMLMLLAGCQTNEPALWREVSYNGQLFIEKSHGMPVTNIQDAVIVASGTETSVAFVDAVELATNKTESQALTLLKSFDTKNGHLVKVIKLTNDTGVTRYWSDPAGKIGRWFAFSKSNAIWSPTDVIRELALPLNNTGKFVTQYTLKNNAVAVYGLCADMTSDPINFGVTATGGGEQLFVPDATTWNVQTMTSSLNPTVITLNEEIRYSKP